MDLIETADGERLNQEAQSEETTRNESISLDTATSEELEKFDTYEDFVASQQATQDTIDETVNNESQEDIDTTGSDDSEATEDTQSTEVDSDSEGKLTDAEFRQLITSNLRANHKDYQFTDPNEIRKLMSFGMNYHKKMNELAPHRKALKTLEQYGLLDPTKLGYAIELLNGDKKAIANLLKEHSVDTYELPDLEESPYKANDYLLSDERVRFDETVERVKDAVNGKDVIDFVSQLDNGSFSEIYSDPTILETLSEHAESGLFNDTLNYIDKEKTLGNIPATVRGIDLYASVAKKLRETNPSKYSLEMEKPKAKVIGSNRQQNTVRKTTHNKQSASIPNNTQVERKESYSGIDILLNASEEELDKYPSWEAFVEAKKFNFQR